MYAQNNIQYEGDPYTIEGIENTDYNRNIIKKILNQAINAEDRYQRFERKILPKGWKHDQILEAIKNKHPNIADKMNTGSGIRLQKLDSDICEKVLTEAINKDIPLLPVHDGFIAPNNIGEGIIIGLMSQIYSQIMKNYEIKIEIK